MMIEAILDQMQIGRYVLMLDTEPLLYHAVETDAVVIDIVDAGQAADYLRDSAEDFFEELSPAGDLAYHGTMNQQAHVLTAVEITKENRYQLCEKATDRLMQEYTA